MFDELQIGRPEQRARWIGARASDAAADYLVIQHALADTPDIDASRLLPPCVQCAPLTEVQWPHRTLGTGVAAVRGVEKMAGKRAAKKARKAAAWATPPAPLTVYRDGLRDALGRSGKTLQAMRRALNTYGAGTLEGDDARVKVWSDLHLGHANIIEYQHRPFRDVGQMDAALWDAWHTHVEPDDTLVCVGDLAMSAGASEATWERVAAAPGAPKVLIVGNHDVGGDGKLRVEGFERNLAVLVTPGEPPLIWTHAPLPDVPDGHVNVHGHTHARRSDGRRINVSVEQLGYRPIGLDRLRRLAAVLVDGDEPPGATTLEQIRLVEEEQ